VSSSVFFIAFVILASIMFTNLFIGIVCAVFVRNAKISNKCVGRVRVPEGSQGPCPVLPFPSLPFHAHTVRRAPHRSLFRVDECLSIRACLSVDLLLASLQVPRDRTASGGAEPHLQDVYAAQVHLPRACRIPPVSVSPLLSLPQQTWVGRGGRGVPLHTLFTAMVVAHGMNACCCFLSCAAIPTSQCGVWRLDACTTNA
jgi:hypothetical protein